jgi:DNA excision repair protein ERCC-2
MTSYAVAVRDLAAFCHRRGDIDHRFAGGPSAQQGIEGHQRVARRRAATWQAEVAVEHSCRVHDIDLLLRGRADGFDAESGVVEEIKTFRGRIERIPDDVSALHWMQGQLYAAVLAEQYDVPELRVHLTWYNVDDDREYTDERVLARAELTQLLQQSLAQYGKWLAHLHAQRTLCRESIRALDFPYAEFRSGQRDMAELVYKCIDREGQLLLEAPTGSGKTAAVLYPALKALAADKHQRLVFASARTVGQRAAEQTLAHFRGAGVAHLHTLTLSAKERVCLSPGKACHGDDCPYARGYYDRLAVARTQALQLPAWSTDTLEALAREHELCPYQLAQDLLPWCDVLICDLHYLFSLTPLLSREDSPAWTVLVDEAHNLPSRAVEMYSARLSKQRLMAVKSQAPAAIARALQRCNRALLALQKEDWQSPDREVRSELPERLVLSLQDFAAVVGEQLALEPTAMQAHSELLEFYFEALHWLRVGEQWGEDMRCELRRTARSQSLSVDLLCLDPARLLAQRHAQWQALIVFSATLSPAHWVHSRMGLTGEAVHRRLDSPFKPEQLVVDLALDVDTRYRQREASLARLQQHILSWLAQVPGNCLVYFPSYAYLQLALPALETACPAERSLWVQQTGQNDSERRALLAQLQSERNVAALCVLGGVFGEGIDLPGDQLSSVIVVGVGLPQVNPYTEMLRDYYQEHHGSGFDFAYLYPAMQKVDQALGRVVRRFEDRGRALLIDSRYGWTQYRDLLPPWWAYRPLPADEIG